MVEKQLYGYFKRQTDKISHQKTWTWLRKKICKRKIESLLIATRNRSIDIMVRVFANGPGDRGSIPDRVKPKTQKMILDTALLSTQNYKVMIKGKVSNVGNGEAPSPTLQCSSY